MIRPPRRPLLLGASVLVIAAGLAPFSAARPDTLAALQAAVDSGRLACRLSDPEEVRAVLGPPLREATRPSGGMLILTWSYDGVDVLFGKMRDDRRPFTLGGALAGGREIDLGAGRKISLRTAADLDRLDSFAGLRNVSLARLDLRGLAGRLTGLPFDTRTEWPPADRLPDGFSPAALLETGRDPGLGVRELHQNGVDGRGVRIAIIDQPLLPDHTEYRQVLAASETIDVGDIGPQMHGPAVLSVAAGRTCGVAPGARVTFFAVPMWKSDNAPYTESLRRIMDWNAAHPDDRVRAVSISTGMFASFTGAADWERLREDAARAGIFLIACDGKILKYGTLARVAGRDPDDPRSYVRGTYGPPDAPLLVPAGGRVIASPEGPDVYTYDPTGGMSWGAPYLAGLAALACQVDPGIDPQTIAQLLLETATTTAVGPVVNPRDFVRRVRDRSGAPR